MSEKFEYKYTAPTDQEKREIEAIKRQYVKVEEPTSKLERLRELDAKVKRTPTILALTLGIVGTLLFGTGMTFFLEWITLWYVGIPLSIIGLILISLAMPVYKKIKQKNIDKYRDEIIELSDSLLNEEIQN